MAGTSWKAAGTILIVLGAVAFVLGIAGAAFGGSIFAGAVADAGDCGGFLNPCSDSVEERAEGGMLIVLTGGAVAVGGLVVAILGIVLVFVGSSRAKKAAADAR